MDSTLSLGPTDWDCKSKKDESVLPTSGKKHTFFICSSVDPT